MMTMSEVGDNSIKNNNGGNGGGNNNGGTPGVACVQTFTGRGPFTLDVPPGTTGTIKRVVGLTGTVRWSVNGNNPPTATTAGDYFEVVGSAHHDDLPGVLLSDVRLYNNNFFGRTSVSYVKDQ